MTTREQDATIERLGLRHGRLAVRDYYADNVVEAVAPNGHRYLIPPHGAEKDAGTCWSVDWWRS